MRTWSVLFLVLAGACEENENEIEVQHCVEEPAESFSSPFFYELDWQHVDEKYGIAMQPAVGQLTDDNGDGYINDEDNPDLLFTTIYGNNLVALHGDGSGVIFEKPGYWGRSSVAIGDVDGDDEPEIVVATEGYEVALLDTAGNEEWVQFIGFFLDSNITLADLDADGIDEILFDGIALDGHTGEPLFAIPPHGMRSPVVADLNQDGDPEVIVGSGVYSSTGELQWTAQVESSYLGVFAEAAELDGDPGLETVFVAGTRTHSSILIHDEEGTLLHSFDAPGANAGQLAVADFDGDGVADIAVAGIGVVTVHQTDGTEIWRAETVDETGMKGVTAVDLDHDGTHELLLADETSLRIFAGATGTVIHKELGHTSTGSSFTRPLVADLDGDSSPEIIVASDNWPTTGTPALSVYTSPGNTWLSGCEE